MRGGGAVLVCRRRARVGHHFPFLCLVLFRRRLLRPQPAVDQLEVVAVAAIVALDSAGAIEDEHRVDHVLHERLVVRHDEHAAVVRLQHALQHLHPFADLSTDIP